MLQTDINGNFGLDMVKRIVLRYMNINRVYVIYFVNDKRKLYASKYHSFLTSENLPKKIDELKVGDMIWIDISAFSADKSLK